MALDGGHALGLHTLNGGAEAYYQRQRADTGGALDAAIAVFALDRFDEVAGVVTDVEEAGALRTHQPFVSAGGVGVTAERLHVDFDLADGLGAVHDTKNVVGSRQRRDFGDGHTQARGGDDVAHAYNAGVSGDGVGEALKDDLWIVVGRGDGDGVDDDAQTSSKIMPANTAAFVLLIGD